MNASYRTLTVDLWMRVREKAGLFLCDHFFKVLPNDTFLVSYPRSGNRWMRNLIAGMKHPAEDLGPQDLLRVAPDMHNRRSFFNQKAHERPRLIKSHCTYREKYPRVIYLYRDGRDVALSYYTLYRKYKNYNGSFEDFIYRMLSGRVEFGSWHGHVKAWMWRDQDIPFMPVRYEDLCSDTERVLREVGDFLNISVDEGVIADAIARNPAKKQNTPLQKKDAWMKYSGRALLDVFWSETEEVMSGLGYKKW